MAVIKFRNPNSVFSPDSEYEDYDEQDTGDEGQSFIDEEIEDSENSRKRRREILRLLLQWALVVGVVLAFAGLLQFLSSQRVYSGAVVSQVKEMTSQNDTEFISLDNNIVYYSKNGANCLDPSGDLVWSISFELQKPLVSRNGDILAIADYNGSTIYLQNAAETIGSVNTNMPIRAMSVSESGEVAAVLADTDVTWVYLFDSSGNTIAYFKTTMGQSGYPLSVSISPGGELVCVSHLLVSSTGTSSSVAFYNFGAVGQNVAENNVSGFNYDNEIFPFTTFLSNSSCAAVSDSRIVFFSGKEIPQSGANAMFTDELEGVYTGNGYIGLLFPDNSSSARHNLQIYNASGEKISTISFEMEFTDIQIAGKNVYINNDQQLQLYTVEGKERYHGSFDHDVREVVPRADGTGKMYLIAEDGIEQLTLR